MKLVSLRGTFGVQAKLKLYNTDSEWVEALESRDCKKLMHLLKEKLFSRDTNSSSGADCIACGCHSRMFATDGADFDTIWMWPRTGCVPSSLLSALDSKGLEVWGCDSWAASYRVCWIQRSQ